MHSSRIHKAIMKKSKKFCHFVNINCMEKFQNTDPLKVWVSSFSSVDGNGISPSAIMKKNRKMATISLTSIIQKNFKLPNPQKFGSPIFWVLRETEYQHQPLWKKSNNKSAFVLSTPVAVSQGVSTLGVVYPRGCLLPLGVCSGGQVSAPGGVCSLGVCSQGGGGVCSL